MKTVILAGGLGTRLSEYTDKIPKPMVRIGFKQILWHIMKTYAHYGFKDFVIGLGYKSELIKDYFLKFKSFFKSRRVPIVIDLMSETSTFIVVIYEPHPGLVGGCSFFIIYPNLEIKLFCRFLL